MVLYEGNSQQHQPSCKMCQRITVIDTFKGSVAGRTYQVKAMADYKTSNMVDMIEYTKCRMEYFGETEKGPHICMSSHWSGVNINIRKNQQLSFSFSEPLSGGYLCVCNPKNPYGGCWLLQSETKSLNPDSPILPRGTLSRSVDCFITPFVAFPTQITIVNKTVVNIFDSPKTPSDSSGTLLQGYQKARNYTTPSYKRKDNGGTNHIDLLDIASYSLFHRKTLMKVWD